MKLNFMWIKKLWKPFKEDSTEIERKSVTLLDLNEHCLRHIGNYMSIEDTYSLGHTCTQLFRTVSKIRSIVTIEHPSELKYLNYFGQEARTIYVDMEDTTQEFTENDQKNLLTIMKKCRKVSNLKLITSSSRILGSAYLRRKVRKLACLYIGFVELPKCYRPNLVKSLKNCEDLWALTIDYDARSSSSSTVRALFETEYLNLTFFRLFVSHYTGVDDDRLYFVPLNTFLRNNIELRVLKIYAPMFEEYLDAFVLCKELEEIKLSILPMAVKLIPKLLILNTLPVLKSVSLWIHMPVDEQMPRFLQQIQSLKKLSIMCTLCEPFILDIFQIQQITSLRLEISVRMLSETIDDLRYYEQSLYNLRTLTLSFDFTNYIDNDSMETLIDCCWITSSDLMEFVKFIINCPKIKLIVLPFMFPIHRFYKHLLKYEKKHVRKKALYLQVANIQWIPGYSVSRRTHNIIIKNKDGDEPDTSISSIMRYAWMEIVYEMPSVFFCLFCMLIGKLIHVIQYVIILIYDIC